MKKLAFFVASFSSCLQLSFGQLVQVASSTTNGIVNVLQHGSQVYFLGHNYLSKTSDLAKTPLQILNIPIPVPYTDNWAHSLNITSSNNIYLILGDKRIVRSQNDGLSWDTIFTVPDWHPPILADLVVNENNVFLTIGMAGRAFRSKGGTTWDTLYNTSITSMADCVIFSDSIFLIGGQEKTAKSFNPGWGWGWKVTKLYDFFTECTGLEKMGGDTVYMCAQRVEFGQYEGYFYKSTNGGETWAESSMGKGIAVNEIEFLTKSHGFAVGSDLKYGIILETLDSGKTWSKFTTNYEIPFYDIELIGDSVMFIVGNDGLILRSRIDSYTTSLPKILGNGSYFALFPNPTKERLFVEIGEDVTDAKLTIYNTLGENVHEVVVQSPKTETDISFLPIGVYSVRLQKGDDQKVVKLVKE